MSTLDMIVKDLKGLPPAQLKEAGGYITHLKQNGRTKRITALKRTAGGLTPPEACELETIIEDGCEKIDARDPG